MNHIFIIYLSANEYLDNFYFLAIIRISGLRIDVQVALQLGIGFCAYLHFHHKIVSVLRLYRSFTQHHSFYEFIWTTIPPFP